MSIESKAGAIKSLGIGVALIAGVYVVYLLLDELKKTKKTAEQGAAYLFGTSDTATLGTDLYSVLHDETFVPDPDQQLKTCLAVYNQKGSVQSDVCKQALMKAGVIQ